MPDLIVQVALRLAVLLPVMLLVAVLAWVKQLGFIKRSALFSAADMRAPGFLLIDAAIFALIFALISVLMSEGPYSAAVAVGISVLLTLGNALRLAARILE
jgi:hypothetical protein